MITFNDFGKLGRIGNQLFQYAAIRNLCIVKNYKLGLPNLSKIGMHGQKDLIKYFNVPKIFFGHTSIVKKIFYSKYIEKDASVIDKDFFNISDNTNIKGYFQSIYYFKNNAELISQELTPKKEFLIEAKEKLKEIKIKSNSQEIVSLHIRRGDNVDSSIKGNNAKLLNSFGDSNRLDKNSFYGKYINNAKLKFKNKNIKFLVFSGGSRTGNNQSDLEWCKNNLIGEEYIFNQSQDEMKDFSLINVCDHNIISPGSSFGWWAAYLNKKKGIVVAPRYSNPSCPTKSYKYMFYPDEWLIV